MKEKIKDYSIEVIKKGYEYDEKEKCYKCIECDEAFFEGEIYPFEDRFYTAEKRMLKHMENSHGNRLISLLNLDKKLTTITDNQKEILTLMASGISDKDIAARFNLSASTVRHVRFSMKEKIKQAKVFIAISELVFGDDNLEKAIIPIHANATMVDDRYNITIEEEEEIIKKMFSSLNPLKLRTFATKEKRKLVILRRIVREIDKDKNYTEKELNSLLKEIYDDFVTLRRYLIEYGFMDRSRDGSSYWIKKS